MLSDSLLLSPSSSVAYTSFMGDLHVFLKPILSGVLDLSLTTRTLQVLQDGVRELPRLRSQLTGRL